MKNNNFKTVTNFITKYEEEGKDFYISFDIDEIGVSRFCFYRNAYSIFISPTMNMLSILQGNDSIDIYIGEEAEVKYSNEFTEILEIHIDNNYITIGEI